MEELFKFLFQGIQTIGSASGLAEGLGLKEEVFIIGIFFLFLCFLYKISSYYGKTINSKDDVEGYDAFMYMNSVVGVLIIVASLITEWIPLLYIGLFYTVELILYIISHATASILIFVFRKHDNQMKQRIYKYALYAAMVAINLDELMSVIFEYILE